MILEFITQGFQQIGEALTDLYGSGSLFDGMAWEVLWSWMGLPEDLYTHIWSLFALFAIFVVIGFVKKLVVIFG